MLLRIIPLKKHHFKHRLGLLLPLPNTSLHLCTPVRIVAPLSNPQSLVSSAKAIYIQEHRRQPEKFQFASPDSARGHETVHQRSFRWVARTDNEIRSNLDSKQKLKQVCTSHTRHKLASSTKFSSVSIMQMGKTSFLWCRCAFSFGVFLLLFFFTNKCCFG